MSEKQVGGSCLCKKVSYRITGNMGVFQYCHCSRCRKVTGSAHAANLFVSPDQFHWLSGEDLVGRYDPVDTKYFATSFCRICGSSLPWAVQGGKNIVVTAGTLDDDPEIKPMWNIFWHSKAIWYEETNQLPKHDKYPK